MRTRRYSIPAAMMKRELPPEQQGYPRFNILGKAAGARREEDDSFQRPLRRRARLRKVEAWQSVQRRDRRRLDLRARHGRHERLDREPADGRPRAARDERHAQAEHRNLLHGGRGNRFGARHRLAGRECADQAGLCDRDGRRRRPHRLLRPQRHALARGPGARQSRARFAAAQRHQRAGKNVRARSRVRGLQARCSPNERGKRRKEKSTVRR